MTVWTRAGLFRFPSLLRPPRRGLSSGDWLDLRFVASISLAFTLIASLIAVTYPLLVAVRLPNTAVHVAAAVAMGTAYALAMAGRRQASGLLLLSTLFLGAWALLLLNFGTPMAPVLAVATVAPAILAFALRRLVVGWTMAAATLAFLAIHQLLFPADPRAAITLGVVLLAVTALAGLAPALRAAERRRADRAESGVRVEAARMRTLLDNLDQAAYVVDRERRVLAANQAAYRLFAAAGLTLRVGKDLLDCLPAAGREENQMLLQRAFAGEEVQVERAADIDGSPRPFVVRVKPVVGEGRMQGAVVAVRDVTEERLHQRLREQQIEQEAELSKVKEISGFKTQLINAASHDLNTPLLPMKVQLHLLRRRLGDSLDAVTKQHMDILERNTDRFAAIVADMLDVARLESGRMRFRRGRVDVARLVQEDVDLLAPDAARRGVPVRVVDLVPCWVEGDAVRISQVVTNLISNAIKFSRGGGSVEVECRRDGNGISILVRDQGIGIAPEAIGTLFQPFQRVRGEETSDVPGTGLGLFICKSIVEAHGGAIGIESPGRGQGTTAWFTLPASVPATRPGAALRPPRPPSGRGGPVGPSRSGAGWPADAGPLPPQARP